jgi:hypothetical protein
MARYAVGELVADIAFDRIVERGRATNGDNLGVFCVAIAAQVGHARGVRVAGQRILCVAAAKAAPVFARGPHGHDWAGRGGGIGETYFDPGKHDQDDHLRLAFIGRRAPPSCRPERAAERV